MVGIFPKTPRGSTGQEITSKSFTPLHGPIIFSQVYVKPRDENSLAERCKSLVQTEASVAGYDYNLIIIDL